PSLFRNSAFVVSCAIGFVVGLALFGSVTYLPVYLQVVRSASATSSGLQLAPMMGGVLLASTICGQLISRFGRYRAFPIAGTVLMTLGLLLLWGSPAEARTTQIVTCALVLGIGLGMVMQVLVLVVQNAVDHEHLGAATSGAVLFRSIGGAIGVALFGAILAASLEGRLDHGIPRPAAGALASPQGIGRAAAGLAAQARAAFSGALHLVFLLAAIITAGAFVLSLFLREVPLRRTLASVPGARRDQPG